MHTRSLIHLKIFFKTTIERIVPAGLAAARLAAHAALVVEADVARVVALAEEWPRRHHRPLEEVLAPE